LRRTNRYVAWLAAQAGRLFCLYAAALKEAEIEIPFPQRDLYLRGVPEGFVFAGTDTDTEK
jgi:small-conductance mechanosensitive channel